MRPSKNLVDHPSTIGGGPSGEIPL